MNSPHHGTQPSLDTFHTIGLMHHGQIGKEVKSFVDPRRSYTISEVSQNGDEVRSVRTGIDIRNRCAEVFGNWLHGFIVRENGSGKLIFVYTGPIPKKVSDILERRTFH